MSLYFVESCSVPEGLQKAPMLSVLAFWSSMRSLVFAKLMVQRQFSFPNLVLLSIWSEFFLLNLNVLLAFFFFLNRGTED